MELFTDDRAMLCFAPDAVLLGGFALPHAAALMAAIQQTAGQSPYRHMETPGGKRMSVAMTSCGAYGWISDRRGYRYSATDPQTGKPWPAMPAAFLTLAETAAAQAGFAGFTPDSCLMNRYSPGTRLTLHRDEDERDFAAPIVSVSLGLPAVFLFGGKARSDPTRKLRLHHGDVVVWGGESRLNYHGVMPLKDGDDPLCGPWRYNLTFRKTQ